MIPEPMLNMSFGNQGSEQSVHEKFGYENLPLSLSKATT